MEALMNISGKASRLAKHVRTGILLAAISLATAAWAQLAPAQAEAAARALLAPGQPAAVQAQATALDQFVRRQSGPLQPDAVGAYHLRFDRTHQGVPVEGGDIIVHLARDGALDSVTRSLAAPINLPSVTPSVERAVVVQRALERFARRGHHPSPDAQLQISAVPGLDPAPRLVWLVRVRGSRCDQPSWMHYQFDAATGVLIRQYEGQESAVPIVCPDPPDMPRR